MNRLLLAFLPSLLLVLAACTAETASTPTAGADAPTDAPTDASTDEPEDPDEPAAGEEQVRLSSFGYDPSSLTIAAGTTVVFTNADSLAHTVTHGTDGQAVDDPFVDEQVDRSETVSVTFDEPGTYDLTCRFHPDMNMTITVEG